MSHFWATAPGSKAREAEEKIAVEIGFELREGKLVECAALSLLEAGAIEQLVRNARLRERE